MSQENMTLLLELSKGVLAGIFVLSLLGSWMWFLVKKSED